MYIVSVMILTFSVRDFGHPQFLKSKFGHPVMKILAKSLISSDGFSLRKWDMYVVIPQCLRVPLKLSSGSMILLMITMKLRMILQNI